MFAICISHWLPVIHLMDPFFTLENDHIVAFKQCLSNREANLLTNANNGKLLYS